MEKSNKGLRTKLWGIPPTREQEKEKESERNGEMARENEERQLMASERPGRRASKER